jgi:hypothetical protein
MSPTPKVTATSTPVILPNLTCSIIGQDSLTASTATNLTSTVSYTGNKSLSYDWTASCGTVNGSSSMAVYTASSVVGNYCQIRLAIHEIDGAVFVNCDKWISITAGGQGVISGFVLTDRGVSCARDTSDLPLPGRTIKLFKGGILFDSTTTDSNGYFNFVRTVGDIYNLVYTLSSSDNSVPSCSIPTRDGNNLVYSNLAVVSSGLTDKNFYLLPGTSTGLPSWMKTLAGDVHSNSDILLNIPRGEHLSSWLVVASYDAFFNFINNNQEFSRASLKNWYITNYNRLLLPSQQSGKFFDYFIQKGHPNLTIFSDVLTSNTFTDNNGKIILVTNATTIIVPSRIEIPNDSSNIFYINGNLKIDSEIKLNENSVLVFVVKGDLLIHSNVKRLDGVFLVDGQVDTRYNLPDGQINPYALDIYGMLYVSSSGKIFSRSRDLGLSGNNLPAEQIFYQPKYLLSPILQKQFGIKNYVWQEVPG